MSSEPDWEGFGKAMFDWAVKFRIFREIPGGFNPEIHSDDYSCSERGDPLYEINTCSDTQHTVDTAYEQGRDDTVGKAVALIREKSKKREAEASRFIDDTAEAEADFGEELADEILALIPKIKEADH